MFGELEFAGKKILITGGSSGIGKATANLLSKFGAELVIISNNITNSENALNELSGDNHSHYYYDLNDINGIELLIKKIILEKGSIDGFVHSAGISGTRPLNLTNYDFLLKIMNVNFFSYVEIIRCITKKNSFNPKMNIVGVSSVGAFHGDAAKTAYNSSKSAMNSATMCLAKELASKGIRINTVAPGVTQTEMYDQFLKRDIDSEDYKAVIQRQYLGICQPNDIANTIVFLLSDYSRMITGSCIGIDGGKLTS